VSVICAWCKADMGTKDGLVGTSHGMCPTCLARMNAEMDAREAAKK